MIRDALISEDGLYRYWLSRTWDLGGYSLPFIMLNPSVADAEIDDPTIRRCVSFAKRESYGGIIVFNLFALRATQPTEMLRAADPVGPENDATLVEAFEYANRTGKKVVAAWGVHGIYKGRGAEVAERATRAGVNLVCLGTTKDGHPKHPLYIASDQPLVSMAEAA